tara:strand:+ start:327 stop:749 length:423 start_codon:yes stop_codon:yes gene_type:complete
MAALEIGLSFFFEFFSGNVWWLQIKGLLLYQQTQKTQKMAHIKRQKMTHARFIKSSFKTNSTYKGISYRINVKKEGTYELVINGNKFDENADPYYFEQQINKAIKMAKMLIDQNRYYPQANAQKGLTYAEWLRKTGRLTD